MSERMTEAEIADLLIRRVGRNGRCEVLCSKAHAEIMALRAELSTERDLSLFYRMELVRIKRALLPFAEAGATYTEADGVDVTNLGVEHYTAAHEAFHHEEPAPNQQPQEGRYMS